MFNLAVLARLLRATSKKGRQLFREKVHPQRKSWLHLWFLVFMIIR